MFVIKRWGGLDVGNEQVKCIENSMSSALSNQEDRGERSTEVEGKAHGQVRVFCFVYTWSDHRNLDKALLSVPISFIAISSVHGAFLPRWGWELLRYTFPSSPGTKTEMWNSLMCLHHPGNILECTLSYFSQQ